MNREINSYANTSLVNLLLELKQHFGDDLKDLVGIEILNNLSDLVSAIDYSLVITVCDPNGKITSVNQKFSEISKFSKEELIGKDHRIVNSGYHSKQFFQQLWKTIKSGQVWEGEICNKAKDGTIYWLKTVVIPIFDSQQTIKKFISIRTDVTSGKHYESQLRQVLKNDYKEIMKNLDSFVFKVKRSNDKGFIFTFVAGKLADQLGFQEENVISKPIQEILPIEILTKFRGYVNSSWEGLTTKLELPYLDKQLLVTLSPSFKNGKVNEVIGVANDITEVKMSELAVKHMAYHDSLTNLPNRRKLDQDLSLYVKQAKIHGKSVGIAFIDFDHFKHINDTLGHSVGDQVLKMAANRLEQIAFGSVISESNLYHLGGDEFVFVFYGMQEDDVTFTCKCLLEQFETSFLLNHIEFHLRLSIGFNMYPKGGQSPEDLLKNADNAMFVAKESGRNTFKVFTPEMKQRLESKFNIENDLRKAIISRDQFTLHFQPQIDSKTGNVIGFEALIRWNHPEKGFMSPLEFIQVAEDTGLIIPIGEWVVEEACCQLKRWQDKFSSRLRMSVNISTRQFLHPQFAQTVKMILDKTKIDPKHLELEITESSLMENTEATASTLTSLRDLGITIAIDDFGTGYSSLSYLKKFPINTLKIDQTFVADLPEDKGDQAIVSTIISLARNFGLKVIAEGVETRDAKHYLQENHCDGMQGYFFSRPLPADEIDLFLHNLFIHS